MFYPNFCSILSGYNDALDKSMAANLILRDHMIKNTIKLLIISKNKGLELTVNSDSHQVATHV